MLAISLALLAAVPRLLGGLAVLRWHDRLHLAMGFAGGALVGVALFETLPEARELTGERPLLVAGLAAAGLLAVAALERPVFGHVHQEDRACHPQAGHVGAGGISVHAFLDGLAIGAAFQASSQLGLLVSAAVLLHAFADGLNTVTVVLRHGGRRSAALAWLAVDAAAPVLGAALGLFVVLPELLLGGLLALFAGMFLYLGAGSLVPRAHRDARAWGVVSATTVAGVGLALAATQLG